MIQKKWMLSLGIFIVLALLFAGVLAIAADIGTKDDPLITESYITQELLPGMNKRIDEAIGAKIKDFENNLTTKYDVLAKELDSKAADLMKNFSGNTQDEAFINAVAQSVIDKTGNTGSDTPGDTMKKVIISAGKTLKLNLGSEIMIRLGSAVCVSSGTPGLIDLSSAGELANGAALEKNHLYMATVDGRGVKASAEATVFVRGTYTLE